MGSKIDKLLEKSRLCFQASNYEESLDLAEQILNIDIDNIEAQKIRHSCAQKISDYSGKSSCSQTQKDEVASFLKRDLSNYYEVLEIERNSDIETIKKSYRKVFIAYF